MKEHQKQLKHIKLYVVGTVIQVTYFEPITGKEYGSMLISTKAEYNKLVTSKDVSVIWIDYTLINEIVAKSILSTRQQLDLQKNTENIVVSHFSIMRLPTKD